MQRVTGHETVLVEQLDLELVTRVRESGTLGLTQTLKGLRDSKVSFPQHQGKLAESEAIEALGSLEPT